MNKKFKIIFGMALLVMAISFVNAFGVATPYWDDMPLRLAPGESKTVLLGLQNMIGGEDLSFEAEITDDGGGIATLVDFNYLVLLGEEVDVPIRVEIPEDAEAGRREIIISFTEIASGEGGMIRLASGISSKFPVEVVGEEESELYSPGAKKGLSGFWMIVIAIVAALIIFAVVRKRKIK